MAPNASRAAATAADEDEASVKADAMQQICEAVCSSIESGGASLPSIELSPSTREGGSCSVQWTSYAPCLSPAHAVVSELRHCLSLVMGRFGSSLVLPTALGSGGRPLIYGACLGLLRSSDRTREEQRENSEEKAGTGGLSLDVFLAVISLLVNEVGCLPTQPTFSPGACRRPPLHLLARACHPAAVRALLDAGANPFQSDWEGWTALMACCMLDEDGRGPTVEDRVGTARLLLDWRAEGDEEGDEEDGDFVLCPGGISAKVSAEVNRVNYRGYTALHLACEGLMAPMVSLLLDRGADATARTWPGESPLGIVAWNEDKDQAAAEECRRYLLKALEKVEGNANNKYALEEQKVVDLINFINETLIPIANSEHSSGDLRDRLLLKSVMMHVQMDPKLYLEIELGSNWYEELNRRVMALIPDAFAKIYLDEPTEDEYDLITSHDGHSLDEAFICLPDDHKDCPGARRFSISRLRSEALVPYRQRGYAPRVMHNFLNLVVVPIQHTVAFAVPSGSVLDRIASIAPRIVEIGAGTGYWSALLRLRGVDALAYDADPLSAGLSSRNENSHVRSNAFFGDCGAFTKIHKGTAEELFEGNEGMDLAASSALLLVWPNNADYVDNPHLAEYDHTPLPVWDIDCLNACLEAGGKTVIYVGEREDRIQVLPSATGPDCGFCSSRQFQQTLTKCFVLEERLDCPRWWLKDDDVTIWKRKD